MKKIPSTVAALAFGALLYAVLGSPRPAFAQWDYGQHEVYNIIENRIDIRKTRARMMARHGKAGATKGGASKSKSKPHSAPVKEQAAALPHNSIAIHRDTFQDFHMDDINGYLVTFNFVPVGGSKKTITKTYQYSHLKLRENADYDDLPVGVYTVKASAVYKGTKYPVHLGTEQGSPTDSTGGNFADSVSLTVKPAKDFYGHMAIQGFPDTIYIRVIE